ncbi:MAG: histidine kinase [Actinomycetota bacterium]
MRKTRERFSAARASRIAIVGSDPYLSFLVRQQLPDVELIEGDAVDAVLSRDPDLVFVAGDHAIPASGNVIHVVEPHEVPEDVEASSILVRPYLPSEVERVLRPFHRRRSEAIPSDIASRARPLVAATRVLAVVLAFILTNSFAPAERARVEPILIGALAYALLRAAVRFGGRTGSFLDAAAGAGFALAAGHSVSPFLTFAFVCAVAAAIETRSWRGVGWGFCVALGVIPETVYRVRSPSVNAVELAPWGGLFVLAALAAGLAGRATRDTVGLQALSEANRLLSMLYGVARTMPEGFDPGSIAATMMDEIRDRLGAPAAALITDEFGNATVAGSFGCVNADSIVGRKEIQQLRALAAQGGGNFKPDELPARVARGIGGTCFFVAPIQRKTRLLGVLVISCERHLSHNWTSMFLRELSSEAGIAFENAHLFGAVRDMSVDQERLRLGRELHDGVAQVLTHLRLELDMIAKQPPANSALTEEMQRLSRVVHNAAGDVRRMIHGLRSPVAARGLAGALRVYLRDMTRPGGPELVFYSAGADKAGHEIEAETFRVAQEAVWNALRHARASHISVVLSIGSDSLALIVEDDGIGFDGYSIGSGHGLSSMRERAARIGGRISISRRDAGGTRVELSVPLTQETSE